MIHSIEIKNFKCFENLKIDDCRRFNVLVGENASGKTALLEAIFLALGHSPNLAVRFRQNRGLETAFRASPRLIEESMWRDYFYDRDWRKTISVRLSGSGPEARSVYVSRGQRSQITIPLSEDDDQAEQSPIGVKFLWKDAAGAEHRSTPKVAGAGLQVDDSEEDLPDFFMYPANQTIGSIEVAQRFSTISRSGTADEFIQILSTEYPWFENLAIEVDAGAPALFVKIRGRKDRMPLANVSGGINRMAAVMLAIASRTNSIVLVDEVENGLYYRHQSALWKGLIRLTREYQGQLIMTTHSEEWLEALVEASDGSMDDIALWRVERSKNGPVIHQFSGKQVASGIKGGEVR